VFGGTGIDCSAPGTVVASAAPSTPNQSTQKRDTSGDGGGTWQQLGPILGAIATGVGVLGFVTFVGGAIEYARLATAGLPAEEAVAIIPTSNLVVVGATKLVPALIIALMATAAFYVWHVLSYGQLLVGGRLSDAADVARAMLRRREGKGQIEDSEFVRGSRLKPSPLKRALAVAVVIFACETVYFFVTFNGRGFYQLAVFALLAIFTVTVSAVVAIRSSNTIWLAVATYLSVAVFVGTLAYAHARDTFQVAPAAVIRQNQKASIGFFIAQTSDRVYLGRIAIEAGEPRNTRKKASRILVFPKEQITDVAIGPLMSPHDAFVQAGVLAQELCDQQLPAENQAGAQTGAKPNAQAGPAAAKANSAQPPVKCWR
jgi:hypothetical protein